MRVRVAISRTPKLIRAPASHLRAGIPKARDRAARSMVRETTLPASAGASTLECMSAVRTTIAGIPIPDSTLASDATQFVQDVSTQLLFDHSRRVFLWASLQGKKLGLDYDPELLYVGAMFHDIDLVEGHRSEHERFEIDEANAAPSSSATACPRSAS
jgi:HD-GYP domain-containing protein (c-di-GMP phosphodiesterase class II)